MQRATRQKSCMEKIQNRPLGVQFCAKSLDDSATGCETLHAILVWHQLISFTSDLDLHGAIYVSVYCSLRGQSAFACNCRLFVFGKRKKKNYTYLVIKFRTTE
jgi:hypothetical protein